MARILYGVLGMGLGHATRAHTVAAGLLDRGHDVQFVTSLQSTRYLSDHYPRRVHDIFGLGIEFVGPRVSAVRTVFWNTLRGLRELPRTCAILDRLFRSFRPDLVISDYEPFSAIYAWRRHVAFISLDNEHALTHCRTERLPHRRCAYVQAYLATRLAILNARRYVITSFAGLPIIHQPATLVPAVLRREVYGLKPTPGDYLLVYLSEGLAADALCRALQDWTAAPVRAYVPGRSGAAGHVQFRPRSTTGFLTDLAGCRGVLASAGYSLLCECLHLRKPMLLIPAAGQYEQELNAHYMEKCGYAHIAAVPSPEILNDFWRRLPDLQETLHGAAPADLDVVLDVIEAELPRRGRVARAG